MLHVGKHFVSMKSEQGLQLTDFNVHRLRKMQLEYQTTFK